MEVTQKISLEMTDYLPLKTVHVKQGETLESRKIEVYLYNNGELLTFSGESVTFTGKLEGSSTAYTVACGVFTQYARIPVLAGMTATAGTMHCELKIEDDSVVLKTPTFDIVIDPSIG